jgi:hypothetical protein
MASRNRTDPKTEPDLEGQTNLHLWRHEEAATSGEARQRWGGNAAGRPEGGGGNQDGGEGKGAAGGGGLEARYDPPGTEG